MKLSSSLAMLGFAAMSVLLPACAEPTVPAPDAAPMRARVLLVELHGFVGCGVDADLLRDPIAEEIARVQDPFDAVVFSIESGGGMLNRVGLLSDLIYQRVHPNARCLAWIQRAESAAALVALNVPELWMPIDGVIGGAVGVERDPVSGEWRALPSDVQEAIGYTAAACATRGGHDPKLALRMTGVSEDGGSAILLTGSAARDAGLARVAESLEEALDQAFGDDGWLIARDSSEAVSAVIAEAERERERAISLQARFEIAMKRAQADEMSIEVADAYFDELLTLSLREDAVAKRVSAFLGLPDWIDHALDRMAAASGEPAP